MKQFLLHVEDEKEFDREDSESIAKELSIVLENEGYTVVIAPMAEGEE
ncbi:MAG: hypothetical protein JWO13_795 [Acidobacteriales bacterium]|nr:hypothetical protein [Terriglobales bacterium]